MGISSVKSSINLYLWLNDWIIIYINDCPHSMGCMVFKQEIPTNGFWWPLGWVLGNHHIICYACGGCFICCYYCQVLWICLISNKCLFVNSKNKHYLWGGCGWVIYPFLKKPTFHRQNQRKSFIWLFENNPLSLWCTTVRRYNCNHHNRWGPSGLQHAFPFLIH